MDGTMMDYNPMHTKPQSYFLRIKELERENVKLLKALKELVDWYDYDPNCIDNCPACDAYLAAKALVTSDTRKQ